MPAVVSMGTGTFSRPTLHDGRGGANKASGTTADYCGTGCQSGFGRCSGPSIKDSFTKALANGKSDDVNGGQWYWDSDLSVFWTWDTPDIIAKKFSDIIVQKGLGGAFAWSLAEDSFDWCHLKALQQNAKQLKRRRRV